MGHKEVLGFSAHAIMCCRRPHRTPRHERKLNTNAFGVSLAYPVGGPACAYAGRRRLFRGVSGPMRRVGAECLARRAYAARLAFYGPVTRKR